MTSNIKLIQQIYYAGVGIRVGRPKARLDRPILSQRLRDWDENFKMNFGESGYPDFWPN